MRRLLLLLSLGAAFVFAACDDDYGSSCELPNTGSIREVCSVNEETGLEGTCLFRLSSQCSSNLCGVFRGSSGFCTTDCSNNDDCPGQDICITISGTDTRMCVPQSVYNR